MSDAFWCVTLSIIVIRLWWRHGRTDYTRTRTEKQTKLTAEQRQLQKDEAQLRRQGYDDELISTILPVINDK